MSITFERRERATRACPVLERGVLHVWAIASAGLHRDADGPGGYSGGGGVRIVRVY